MTIAPSGAATARFMSERVAAVSTVISPGDEMFSLDTTWDSYIGVAVSAVDCIRRSMELAGKRGFESILDLACGHGRVLRLLKATFPDAKLTACDLNEDGVRFCAAEFGAAPVVSHEDPELVPLTGSFDLVWCGSLFTHLDEPRWDGFMTLVESGLEAGGLFVFTLQGRQIAEAWRGGARDPRLPPDRIERILAGYDASGFGYAHWEGERNWGDSLVKPDWVRQQIERREGLTLIDYVETGWAGAQDVATCVRPDVPA